MFRRPLLLVLALTACPGGGAATGDTATDPPTQATGETTGAPATTGLPTTGGTSSGAAETTTGDVSTSTSGSTTGDVTSTGEVTASSSTGAAECQQPGDCPLAPDPCSLAVCEAGTCSTAPARAGTPVDDPVAGDCQQPLCDGAGGTVEAADDADLPTADGTCQVGICTAGVPGSAPAPVGAPCDAGVCDASGECVGCLADGDCDAGQVCEYNDCVQALNGCTLTNSEDLIFYDTVEVFTNGLTYEPRCIRVFAGTTVRIHGDFAAHPLRGGEVVGDQISPDDAGPFPLTDSGAVHDFSMPGPGAYGYYCTEHAQLGMTGAVFVE